MRRARGVLGVGAMASAASIVERARGVLGTRATTVAASIVERARRYATIACSAAIVVLALAVAASFVPVWPLDLAAHFGVQLVGGGLVLAAVAVVLRIRFVVDVALIATLVAAVAIVHDLGRPRVCGDRAAPDLRVLSLNVQTENTSYAAVRALIEDARPDLVVLMEVDRRWLTELAPALARYRTRIEHPRPDNFGIAMYGDDLDGAVVDLGGGGVPSIVADRHGLRVIAIHTLPPASAAAERAQGEQLARVAQIVRGDARPTLAIGDFNATPWSPALIRFAAASGLCDTRAGFGLQATFPADEPLLRIPIDHAFVSCDVEVFDRRVGPPVGSDHLPLSVDLDFRASAP